MKSYNHCAISVISGKVYASFGSSIFASETAARQYVAEDFFSANKHYPHEIRITPIATELLRSMLNANEGNI